MKQYNEYMAPENIDTIRDRLLKIMYKHNKTFAELGKEMGISNMTVEKFIAARGKPVFLTMMKIENYVIEMESK